MIPPNGIAVPIVGFSSENQTATACSLYMAHKKHCNIRIYVLSVCIQTALSTAEWMHVLISCTLFLCVCTVYCMYESVLPKEKIEAEFMNNQFCCGFWP
jgi:hypothetical protein